MTGFGHKLDSVMDEGEICDHKRKNALLHIYRVHRPEPELKRQFLSVLTRCGVSEKKLIN